MKFETHGTLNGKFHGEEKKADSGIRFRFDGAATIADAEVSRDLALPISILFLVEDFNITASSMYSWHHPVIHQHDLTQIYIRCYPSVRPSALYPSFPAPCLTVMARPLSNPLAGDNHRRHRRDPHVPNTR